MRNCRYLIVVAIFVFSMPIFTACSDATLTSGLAGNVGGEFEACNPDENRGQIGVKA